MLKQRRIDEFFKSTSSRQALKNVDNNSDGKKRKKLQHSRKVYRDIRQQEEQNISLLSQGSTCSISSVTSAECTIIYESFNGLSQEDHNDATLLFQDDDIADESTNLTFIEDDIDMSSVNKPRENMLNNNKSRLRRAQKEMEYNNEFFEETPIKEQAIFNKSTSPKADNSSSSSRLKRSNYSLKMSSGKSPKKQMTEKLFDQFVNIEIAKTVIEHMNLAKQGAIPQNNFDLEETYSTGTFDYHYGQINTEASINYELENVNLPRDLHAKVLIGSIFTVLSKFFNCGYLKKTELDFLYSVLTLPERGQMLLARMIKRKRGWHRIRAINYPDISNDLKDVFNLLESQFICTSEIKDESLILLLDLLQADELRHICRDMKIDCKGRKNILIDRLIKLSVNKSLFPGMRCPKSALYDCIFNMLNDCIRITNKTWTTIDTIMTLLLPNEDSESSMSDIFRKLYDIYFGNIEFPTIHENQFPIFSSRSHLIDYMSSKSILSKTLISIQKKQWENAQSYGELAMEKLPSLLETENQRLKYSTLPIHVRKFMPGYVWLKILWKSIDAFRRTKDMIKVEEILNFLIEQNCHMQTYKGKWYCELATVKMHHHKNVDSSALVIIEALNCEYLSQEDKIDLLHRAKKIFNKKTNVKPETKMNISQVLNDYSHQMPTFDTKIVIFSSLMSKVAQGRKSNWLIQNSDGDDSYGTVETVALYHYKEQQNFPNGLHCEGNLPILLFTTLFWEELYEKQVPGAFATPYEIAPADLYTKHFYEHRKQDIDIKLHMIDFFNADPASFSTWMEARFGTYRQYQSLMPTNLLQHNIYMKEIVYCLGVPGVTGICKRMLENFKLWSAGFPDLIVWNYDTKQHKIVEVKGPGDNLSTKQQLWLEYLNELGLNVEVCLVKDKKAS